ncbi:MAG: hypothetical protein RLY31_2188 [Bacteroidota bacterium]|jgi:CrcB protein
MKAGVLDFVYVFIGGGLGSMCRYGIGRLWVRVAPGFPWSTFAANVTACLALGLLVGLGLRQRLSPGVSLLLMVGFCGGFSTFSTFSNETFQLLSGGDWGRAFLYVAGSLLTCLGSLYAGIRLVS